MPSTTSVSCSRRPGTNRPPAICGALVLFRDLGNKLGQAGALNRFGELASRTLATDHARQRHTQALAIARDLGALPEEGRALEGPGRVCLQDGDPGEAAVHLTQALKIYQRIGAPATRPSKPSRTTG